MALVLIRFFWLCVELWVLQGLAEKRAAEPPLSSHPDRKVKCPSWLEVVTRLQQKRLITKRDLRLTKVGQRYIDRQRTLYPDGFPKDEAFRVHVGPIATGSRVVEDGHVFDRLAKVVRKVLGLEMEAAAIGMVADIEKLPFMIVAKGVVDHADHEKDDSFRTFAAFAFSRVSSRLFAPRADTI